MYECVFHWAAHFSLIQGIYCRLASDATSEGLGFDLELEEGIVSESEGTLM